MNLVQYDESLYQIEKIEFSILGNTELLNYSAFGRDSDGVQVAELYDNMKPVENGLVDARMGTTDHSIECVTCGLNYQLCPGHIGHLKLNDKVFNAGYLEFVKKVLSCVCLKCSRLLIPPKNIKNLDEVIKNKANRFRINEIKQFIKNLNFCPFCNNPVSKIKKDIKRQHSTVQLTATTNIGEHGSKDEQKTILMPSLCYNILRNVRDSDSSRLGIPSDRSRPEMMIYDVFPIPPIPVRPSTRTGPMSRVYEDSLTRPISDVVKSNKKIGSNKLSNVTYDPNAQQLQMNVIRYYDKDQIKTPKKDKDKNLKSLAERLKGKKGLPRDKLMGKRVNFCGRSVITPDPTIHINQVGVPIFIAMIITIPEEVTDNNIDELTKLCINGPKKYPGANYIIGGKNFSSKNRQPKDLRFVKEINLMPGDIVERHLKDGDIILFNRQPTLHIGSMMAHYVKVIKNPNYKSFRFNISITTPYGADFDGDEMNIFAPQSIGDIICLSTLAMRSNSITAPIL